MIRARTLVLGGLAALLLCSASAAYAKDQYTRDSFQLKEDAGPNYRYPDGSTPLMWAVYDGKLDKAASLIKAGADVNASNRYGSNAMQLAAEVANVPMLEMLLKAGADVESANPEGQTALMLVARTGNVDAAKLLVKHGANVNAMERWGDQTAIMWASARRHPEMVDYLASKGADVDARSKWRDYKRHLTAEARAKNLDSGGLTPLLYAARENCAGCVEALIKHHVDINKPDPDRVSPLLMAVLNTNWDVAKELIDAGADVNLWDKYGQSPLYAVASRRQDDDVRSIDQQNKATGDDIMKSLIAKGANVNMQLFMRPAKQRGTNNTRGATPLHAAASADDAEAVKLLLAAGAEVNLNTADNQSALMMSLASGAGSFLVPRPTAGPMAAVKVINVLLKAGADVNTVAHYHHLQRTRGGTALHYAVRARNAPAMEALIAGGADVNKKDPDGLTALDYAMERGYIPFLSKRVPPHKKLAKILRDHGATVELAKAPDWPPVGPPVYYEASVWPLAPDVLDKTYENLKPSEFLEDEVAKLKYP